MALSKCNIFCVKCAYALFCVLFLILWSKANAQHDGGKSTDSLSWDFDEEKNGEFSIGTFLTDIFTPQIVTDIKRIRGYVLDERFQTLRNRCGDMCTIDAIYLMSLKIADYNIARALFLSLMAVLEHRKVDVKMPIFKSLKVPLSATACERESVSSLAAGFRA